MQASSRRAGSLSTGTGSDNNSLLRKHLSDLDTLLTHHASIDDARVRRLSQHRLAPARPTPSAVRSSAHHQPSGVRADSPQQDHSLLWPEKSLQSPPLALPTPSSANDASTEDGSDTERMLDATPRRYPSPSSLPLSAAQRSSAQFPATGEFVTRDEHEATLRELSQLNIDFSRQQSRIEELQRGLDETNSNHHKACQENASLRHLAVTTLSSHWKEITKIGEEIALHSREEWQDSPSQRLKPTPNKDIEQLREQVEALESNMKALKKKGKRQSGVKAEEARIILEVGS